MVPVLGWGEEGSLTFSRMTIWLQLRLDCRSIDCRQIDRSSQAAETSGSGSSVCQKEPFPSSLPTSKKWGIYMVPYQSPTLTSKLLGSY